MKKRSKMKRGRSDIIFDTVNFIIMAVVLVVLAYPLYFVMIASISDPNLVNSGKVLLLPKGIGFEAYERILNDNKIITGYINSIKYTVIGTCISLICTVPAGYALSRKDMFAQKPIMILFVFVMYFQGGLIPTYLVVKNLGLLDSMWAVILPTCVSIYNVIVCKNFFENSLPQELLDAARIDGAGNITYFFRVALPLSKAMVAVMVLFYGVQQWNAYFDAMIYLSTEDKFPLQIVLRDILILAQMSGSAAGDAETVAAMQRIAELVKYGAIVVASIPMLILYPLVQKHFVKGVMVGSVKG